MQTNESDALRDKIAIYSSNITSEIREELGSLEEEYLTARKEQRWGKFLLLTAFIGPFIIMLLLGERELTAFLIIILIPLSLWYGLKLFFRNFRIISKYNLSVDKIIFARVFLFMGIVGEEVADEVFNSTATRPVNEKFIIGKNYLNIPGSNSYYVSIADLDNSELITKPHNTNLVGNVFEIKYRDSKARIAELEITNVTRGNKHTHIEHIFQGYFVSFDLKRELAGKTFVSADSDKRGFGDLSAFGSNKPGQAKETILEWNEFENLLHVATTDEVEARCILTPNFMHDLYDWWHGRQSNIRLSFIKNRLYILYPDSKIRLNKSVEKITEEAVAEYLYTIAWPLQNVLKLIDDVKL